MGYTTETTYRLMCDKCGKTGADRWKELGDYAAAWLRDLTEAEVVDK